MKKIFAIALISSSFFISCEKAFEQPADYSSVAIIQASPVLTTSPSDTLHVFVDNMKYNSTGILFNANSTYLPVLSGPKVIDIRRGVAVSTPSYVSTFNYTFERGKSYSFFVYDTTTSVTGVAKVLRLVDDLTLPTGTNTHVRFLHLAPTAAAYDVTLLRTSVTPNDSITITNRPYVGGSPNEEALSTFMPIPGGTYVARIKLAGTQSVVLSSSVALNTGRIVTLYATGAARNRPLTLGSFRHY